MELVGSSEQVYTSYKPLLFSLAYRMLGSVMDAEDVVQEAFLYVNEKNPLHIDNPKAYLCKIVTNRCIDKLRSASKKCEVYVGPWLPEPLVTSENNQTVPDLYYAQKESLSTAYLLLLQQLSWIERAVFLLREVLQYEYDEIAEIVGKSSTNCRQIFRRAKSAISSFPDESDDTKVQFKQPALEQTSAVVEQFVQALVSGNIGQLLHIVKADAVLYSDGGGKVKAAIRPIMGAERIALFFSGLLSKVSKGFSYSVTTVNGQTGIIAYNDGQPLNVTSFHVEDGQIAAVYIVVNPDKLKHVSALR